MRLSRFLSSMPFYNLLGKNKDWHYLRRADCCLRDKAFHIWNKTLVQGYMFCIMLGLKKLWKIYGAYICIDKKVLQEFFHRFLRLGSPGLKRDYFS